MNKNSFLTIKGKKGQVSFFIIIGIILILFFIVSYFIFNEGRSGDLKEGRDVDTASNLLPIKENVDICLNKQLQRALIIAGLKGGFIYEKDEYYSPSSMPPNSYDPQFIANLGLNWNSLLSSTLVYSQTDVFIPLFNSTLNYTRDGVNHEVYSHSIEEDFEKFILNEFILCLDLERYEDAGFDLTYEKYGGYLTYFNSRDSKVGVYGLGGDIGDSIEIEVNSNLTLEGTISDLDSKNNMAVVDVDLTSVSSLVVPKDLNSIKVYNLNSSIDIDVIFTDEEVSVDLKYPIVLKDKNGVVTKLNDAFVSSEVRFKKLNEMAALLLRAKNENRSIEYRNGNDVTEILKRYPYLQISDLDDLSFYVTIVNESEEYKKYVYSFIDSNSRILTNPYVYSFGYENEAPIIETSRITSGIDSSEGVVFFLSKNTPFNFDVKTVTYEKQAIDVFQYQFLEDDYVGFDAEYHLDYEGKMSFVGHINKKYVFDVKVNDREALRTVPFVFVVGLPNNENNSAVLDCFDYKNYPAGASFPISQTFNDKLFKYNGTDGKSFVYGYSLFTNQSRLPQKESELTFGLSCLLSPVFFGAKVNISNYRNGNLVVPQFELNTTDYKIEIPKVPYPVKVSVEVYEKTSGFLPTDPYEIVIYPSSCLGPNEVNASLKSVYGGSLTCCDTSRLLDSITNNNPRAFVNSNSVLFDDNRVVVDSEAYFCYDLSVFEDPFLSFLDSPHKDQILWDLNSDATSLLEANIKSTCTGNSAYGSIREITHPTGKSFGNTKTFYNYAGGEPLSVDFTARVVTSANQCQFCYLENTSDYVIELENGMFLASGLKAQNLNSGVMRFNEQNYSIFGFTNPLVVESFLNNVSVMCSYDTYRSNDGIVDNWDTILEGRGGRISPIHISKGYCARGNDICSGKLNSDTYDVGIDTSCRDFYYDSSSDSIEGVTLDRCPTNYTCNSYGSCELIT